MITALESSLPCSGGERRMLQVTASLADGTPVDRRNASLIVGAAVHAAGLTDPVASGQYLNG